MAALLSFAGYVIGTPKAIYFLALISKVLFLRLQRFALYGKNSGAPIGLYGQWAVFENAVGIFAYYLFILCFIWFAVKLILWRFGKLQMDEKQAQAIIILIATVLHL